MSGLKPRYVASADLSGAHDARLILSPARAAISLTLHRIFQGPPGPQGDPGPQGSKGEDGDSQLAAISTLHGGFF